MTFDTSKYNQYGTKIMTKVVIDACKFLVNHGGKNHVDVYYDDKKLYTVIEYYSHKPHDWEIAMIDKKYVRNAIKHLLKGGKDKWYE